ncbi:MAG TPA: LptF/LptG family permease, partial [Bdellovibrionota bacterium]|nr:LptF/LptG family permease [Bdellovibrionota bacterium]
MKLKIIQKYLIFELLPQFFMAMFIFSFITCLAELFTQQNNFSFGFDFVFWSKISFFLLLQNAALIVPISFFYACLVSLGQMILQNEIIALKSCGFSYFILLRPLLLMATCLSIICFLV